MINVYVTHMTMYKGHKGGKYILTLSQHNIWTGQQNMWILDNSEVELHTLNKGYSNLCCFLPIKTYFI